ncbi:MAG: hypothetical protein IKY83_04985 [Proteobacteria bacterium]|nr:hypothetical protein [Pseudomonadota bacterium]
MVSFSYIIAVVMTVACFALLVTLLLHSGRFYGKTLSLWIDRTRRRKDEYSAEKLQKIRKHLEVLAHDVLKHRLLGLASLIREMKQETDQGKKIQDLPEAKLEAYRAEFFRLCGIKAHSEERLWNRWIDCFRTVYMYLSRSIVMPFADPMFSAASRELMALRRMVVMTVDRERSATNFVENVMRLRFESCVDVYPKVLELASACQMQIEPDHIVRKAIDTVAVQTKRADIAEHVHIYQVLGLKLLCPAASRTLEMCLTRLLDNALEISNDVAVDIVLDVDAFTGISTLIFKVYDTDETIPKPSGYGMGIRGIRQSISGFEGGFQYRGEIRDQFKKAAILSFPVSEYVDCPVSHVSWRSRIVAGLATFVLFALGIIGLLYVIGGPPVQFAGRGESIVEFTATVGETLEIPLCSGGRNVRVEVENINDACMADNCTFGHVLQAIEPCARSIEDAQCPGVIRWTPAFDDGQRQGKNYELMVRCIADGPPYGEDIQRIRVLVTRPNSEPRILLTQLVNETRGELIHLTQDRPAKVGVTDRLMLRITASDADADVLTYRLRSPDGSVKVSTNGVFWLEQSWSSFATSMFELEVTDNISSPVVEKIMLEADMLHAIELRSMGFRKAGSSVREACEGTSESRVCHLTDPQINTLDVQLWFDPLQRRVRPIIEVLPYDIQNIEIRCANCSGNETLPGAVWEVYSRQAHQLLGFFELINIEQMQADGLYTFTFKLVSTPVTQVLANLAIHLNVSEYTRRMPSLNAFVILSRNSAMYAPVSFSSRHLSLREYERDEDEVYAHASTWIYPTQGDRSTDTPRLGDVVCQTPEFADAFEKPQIRNVNNAWKVDFSLRRGCIAGLNMNLPGKQRLCAVDVQFGGEQVQSDAIWLMLEPRSCAPKIESLSLVSTREERANNAFKWRFRIIDTDGDLPLQAIEVSGVAQYALDVAETYGMPGNAYMGMISVDASCADNAFQNAKIMLRAHDNDNNVVEKQLQLQPSCPPLVSTAGGQTDFSVDEHQHLSIPLHHDSDVKLQLLSRFGALTDSGFEWDATCEYGKGPHRIEIRTEAPTRFGRPLVFNVSVDHCKPQFDLFLDQDAISSGGQIILPAGEMHTIRLVSAQDVLDSGAFWLRSAQISEGFSIGSSELPNGWQFAVSCEAPDSLGQLEIVIGSADDGALEPVRLSVYCVGE